MKLKSEVSSDKLRGGYYTPVELAEKMVRIATDYNEYNTVLEPSCGDGVFVEACGKYPSLYITAIEQLRKEYNKVEKKNKKNERVTLHNVDFYDFYAKHTTEFDLIVGNPPYIRYQYLTEKQRSNHSRILIENGLKSNKLINAWVSFTVASISLLRDGGFISFVLPADLLQIKYSEDLRKYILQSLKNVRIINFRSLIFPSVEQDVVILMGEKTSSINNEHLLKMLQFDDIDDFCKNYENKDEGTRFHNVKEFNDKWSWFFLSKSDEEVLRELYSNAKQFQRFSEIATVDVGITTGNNKVFCLDNDTVKKYKLVRYTIPLIARSVNMLGLEYTQADFEYNIKANKKAFLLCLPAESKEKLKGYARLYVEEAEKKEEHKGYKCSIREYWYKVPSIWIPDAFFLRRNNIYPKFVINNHIDAVSTDTMHRIRFVNNENWKRSVLSVYNSFALLSLELNARSYGGGVLEVLPRELENTIIPNLLDKEKFNDDIIDIYYDLLDNHIRTVGFKNLDGVINKIDKELICSRFSIDEIVLSRVQESLFFLRGRRTFRGRSKKLLNKKKISNK